jgi:hypothetical protein
MANVMANVLSVKKGDVQAVETFVTEYFREDSREWLAQHPEANDDYIYPPAPEMHKGIGKSSGIPYVKFCAKYVPDDIFDELAARHPDYEFKVTVWDLEGYADSDPVYRGTWAGGKFVEGGWHLEPYRISY